MEQKITGGPIWNTEHNWGTKIGLWPIMRSTITSVYQFMIYQMIYAHLSLEYLRTILIRPKSYFGPPVMFSVPNWSLSYFSFHIGPPVMQNLTKLVPLTVSIHFSVDKIDF